MRPLILALAAAATITSPVYAAQDHAAHHPPAPKADAAGGPTHEMCKSVMSREMAGKPVHDHGRDKTGAPTSPNGKPLTSAEMEAMHKTCAARMQSANAAPKSN